MAGRKAHAITFKQVANVNTRSLPLGLDKSREEVADGLLVCRIRQGRDVDAAKR